LFIAEVGVDNLRSKFGTNYRIGTPSDLLYPAAGGSFDWAKSGAGIKHVFALELRPTHSGSLDSKYGFFLPAESNCSVFVLFFY
jgi:hypothetical protein